MPIFVAMSKNFVIISAFVKFEIKPPITGTTKKASLENLYLSQTVFIVVIETGTAPVENPR